MLCSALLCSALLLLCSCSAPALLLLCSAPALLFSALLCSALLCSSLPCASLSHLRPHVQFLYSFYFERSFPRHDQYKHQFNIGCAIRCHMFRITYSHARNNKVNTLKAHGVFTLFSNPFLCSRRDVLSLMRAPKCS